MAIEVIRKSPKDSGKVKHDKGSKNNQIFTGVIAFASAFLLIALVIFGTFYLIIYSNVNGIGDKYRSNIEKIPIMKHALPKTKDFDDPSQFTHDELLNKYIELKKSIEELNRNYNLKKGEFDSADEEVKALKMQLENSTNKYFEADSLIRQSEEYVKKANELLASGDKAGFKEYYEKVDKETAQKIYSEIIQEQKVSEDVKKFLQLYEALDPVVTAKIFEEMGADRIDLITLILKSMKKDISAEIIAEMQTAFAAKVTDKLSVLIKP